MSRLLILSSLPGLLNLSQMKMVMILTSLWQGANLGSQVFVHTGHKRQLEPKGTTGDG